MALWPSEGLLRKFPTIADERAENIVHAARLYRTALESIESRPDIAYQLLISTVETLASAELADYEPTETEKIETKRQVQEEALKCNLSEEKANRLAILACQGSANS